MSATVISAIAIILIVTLLLVVALLVVKNAVTPKGSIKIDINNGKKVLEVNPGNSLMTTLANEKIFLPSACGGKANCGQCKVQVFEGGWRRDSPHRNRLLQPQADQGRLASGLPGQGQERPQDPGCRVRPLSQEA